MRYYFESNRTENLLSDRMLRKTFYLPINLLLTLSSNKNQNLNENYLRMLRIPFIFYKSKLKKLVQPTKNKQTK